LLAIILCERILSPDLRSSWNFYAENTTVTLRAASNILNPDCLLDPSSPASLTLNVSCESEWLLKGIMTLLQRL